MKQWLSSVTVDKQGRITLPKKARKNLEDAPLAKPGDILFVCRKGDVLIIGKNPIEIEKMLNISEKSERGGKVG